GAAGWGRGSARRGSPRRGLFNNRLFLLHRPPNNLGRLFCHVLILLWILLWCFALEHAHPPCSASTHHGQSCLLAIERELTQSLSPPPRSPPPPDPPLS